MASRKKTSSDIREQINRIYEENELANLLQNKNRARSVAAGTAFGGSIEISMRGDYSSLYAIMQPVEVVEFIEQLAASAGLQVALRPKHDFASWRGWNSDIDDKYWAGSAPWNQQRLDESKEVKLLEGSDTIEDELDDITEENTVEQRQKRRIERNKKIHRERTKEELAIQKEISDEIGKKAISNIEKIRENALKNLEKFRKEVEDEAEKRYKKSVKEHEEFVDEVLE